MLLFFAQVSSVFAAFPDVYETHPNATAIEVLVEQGVLEGYPDNYFRPDQEVNRAEAVKIILMGLDIPVDMSATSALYFPDVLADAWYLPYLSTAYDLGIIEGYPDGFFRPEQTVNRAEALKMALEVLGMELEFPSEEPFSDVPEDTWFAPYADYAKTYNIEPAQEDGLWHGEENITRGNMAEIVYRLQQVGEEEEAFLESTNWQRISFRTVSVSLKIPYSWAYKVDGVGAVWILDHENGQISPLSPYGNGATLLMSRYTNSTGESAADLFENLGDQLAYDLEEATINGYPALVVDHNDDLYYKEWYVYLPNDTVVHFIGMRGEGEYAQYTEDYLDQIVESMEYELGGTQEYTVEELVDSLYSLILVDGMGMDMLSLIPTLELLETDPIGVGTGPVDYYYFPEADLTIKYERSFDVILGVREGSTTAF